MTTYDSLIIGGGPAGLSAAIYLARYNRTVLVVDHSRGRWASHEVNENYLGFPNGIPARRLRARGKQQAKRFGAEFTRAKVTSVCLNEGVFEAQAGKQLLRGKTVILATGVVDQLPDIGDTQEYWGKTLFWCITCDGWKVRGKRVVIVGKTDEAAVECMQFRNFTEKLTLVTNCSPDDSELTGQGLGRLRRAGIPVHVSSIDRVVGAEGIMRSVVLTSGKRIATDYMFSKQGCEPRTDLAIQLGVKLSRTGYIKTDDEQRTNVPRVYAAGDVTQLFAHQIVSAAHEGAAAGTTANYDLYEPDQQE